MLPLGHVDNAAMDLKLNIGITDLMRLILQLPEE